MSKKTKIFKSDEINALFEARKKNKKADSLFIESNKDSSNLILNQNDNLNIKINWNWILFSLALVLWSFAFVIILIDKELFGLYWFLVIIGSIIYLVGFIFNLGSSVISKTLKSNKDGIYYLNIISLTILFIGILIYSIGMFFYYYLGYNNLVLILTFSISTVFIILAYVFQERKKHLNKEPIKKMQKDAKENSSILRQKYDEKIENKNIYWIFLVLNIIGSILPILYSNSEYFVYWGLIIGSIGLVGNLINEFIILEKKYITDWLLLGYLGIFGSLWIIGWGFFQYLSDFISYLMIGEIISFSGILTIIISRNKEIVGKRKDAKEKKVWTESQFENAKMMCLLFFIAGLFGIYSTIWFKIDGQMIYSNLSFVIMVICLSLSLVSFIIALKASPENENPLVKLTESDKRSLLTSIVSIIVISILVICSIFIEGFPLDITAWSIVIVAEIRILIFVINKVQDASDPKNEKKYPNFNKNIFISQSIIFMILIMLVIHIMFGNNILFWLPSTYNTNNSIFTLAMVCVSLFGLIGVLSLMKSPSEKFDIHKTSIFNYMIMIIIPLIVIQSYPSYTGLILQVYEGQTVAGGEWFNSIYFQILRSPYTIFSMVMVLLSSIMVLIGKATHGAVQGGGRAQMVLGALGLGGVPIIVVLSLFAGGIEAPPVFYELFADGFAELVFAISYASMLGMIMSIVGVFYELIPIAEF